ncbi:MAG: hypothetical protein KAI95_19640, partial [Bacteroidales bacterium]|nr:hypothetical protein [Bacteroidales bacterium]
SDIAFKLTMGEKLEGFSYAPEIVLYPGRIAILRLSNIIQGKEGESDINIPYIVTNLFTGPDEHLSVTLDMQVNLIPEE